MLRTTIVRLGVLGLAALGCGGGGGARPADGGARDVPADRTMKGDGQGDGHGDARLDGIGDASTAQTYALTVTAVDPTFVTEDHFIAAVEMQLSGEPFAEAMGRDLGGYTRDYACQDATCQASVYTDPKLGRRQQ